MSTERTRRKAKSYRGVQPRSAVMRSQDDLIAGRGTWLDKQIRLLQEYENAVRRYVRGTGSQADLSKYATAAIVGGVSTDRLQQIRDDVQRELLRGDFKGHSPLGDSTYHTYSVGQRVIEAHFGPGTVTMVRGIHIGVKLDDGKFMYATSESLKPSGEKQRYFEGGAVGDLGTGNRAFDTAEAVWLALADYNVGGDLQSRPGASAWLSRIKFKPGLSVLRDGYEGLSEEGKAIYDRIAAAEEAHKKFTPLKGVQLGQIGSSAAVHREREEAFARSAGHSMERAEEALDQGHCLQAFAMYGDARHEFGTAEAHSHAAGEERSYAAQRSGGFEQRFRTKCLRKKR